MKSDNSATDLGRVLGVPGDVVQLKGREVLINQGPIDWKAVSVTECGLERLRKEHPPSEEWECRQERLEGRMYRVLWVSGPSAKEDHGPQQVPSGHYFVLGDNRSLANENRSGGIISDSDLQGIVVAFGLAKLECLSMSGPTLPGTIPLRGVDLPTCKPMK